MYFLMAIGICCQPFPLTFEIFVEATVAPSFFRFYMALQTSITWKTHCPPELYHDLHAQHFSVSECLPGCPLQDAEGATEEKGSSLPSF